MRSCRRVRFAGKCGLKHQLSYALGVQASQATATRATKSEEGRITLCTETVTGTAHWAAWESEGIIGSLDHGLHACSRPSDNMLRHTMREEMHKMRGTGADQAPASRVRDPQIGGLALVISRSALAEVRRVSQAASDRPAAPQAAKP